MVDAPSSAAAPPHVFHTPLRPFIGGSQRRAKFSVAARPVVELPIVDTLLVGAAEVDITPPPGLPKAGYSANAHDGNGFHTRLRARVVHLRHGRSSVAIVCCDLLGGSSVLQRLVADAVAERTDIPLEGLMIGATHTHAGPGQFLGTDFYNRFASNRSGFDPAWAEFLVERIAGAVIEAYDTRAPGVMAFGSAEVWGLTRNRSLPPHVNNETVADKRTEPQRKWVSVNPHLQLLRLDTTAADGTHRPLAAMVVFSVHGTGVSMGANEYNADLWAYLVGELSLRIGEADPLAGRCVVGAIEGTHADVAPAIRPGMAGHVEAQRVGRGIGAEAAALYERLADELTADVEIGSGLREIDLETSRSIDGIELPNRPAVGAALVAGAHENLTPVLHRIPPFKAGTRKPWTTRHPQGAKWVIGSRWLQPVILPLRSFPRIVPVQVFRLGPVVMVGLPFEVTVESGRRISDAVMAGLTGSDASGSPGGGIRRVVVSSVANEYMGYVATAEEYELQFYEGGHTLYGPDTQPFLAAHAAKLVGEVLADDQGRVADVVANRTWDLRVERYLPVAESTAPRRIMVDVPRFTDPTPTSDGCWEFAWRDAAPGDLAWHESIVRIEQSDDGETWEPAVHRGRMIDDSGWAIEVTHTGHDAVGHLYRARWFNPAFKAGRKHRFLLVANAAQPEMAGPAFD